MRRCDDHVFVHRDARGEDRHIAGLTDEADDTGLDLRLDRRLAAPCGHEGEAQGQRPPPDHAAVYSTRNRSSNERTDEGVCSSNSAVRGIVIDVS